MEEKGKEGNGKETPDHLCLRHLNPTVATAFVFNKYHALLTIHIAFGTKSDFRENDSQRRKSNPFGLKSFFPDSTAHTCHLSLQFIRSYK